MSVCDQELEEFKTEAIELLDGAERNLLSLTECGSFQKIYDSVFRCFHNLKGACGMMELTALQAHVHELETALVTLKNTPILSKSQITYFLSGIDAARSLLSGANISFDYSSWKDAQSLPETAPLAPNFSQSQDPCAAPASVPTTTTPVAGLEEFTAECSEILDRAAAHLRKIEAQTHTFETMNDLYRDIHSLKGGAHLFGYTLIGELAHAMESSMEPLREGTHDASKILIDLLYRSTELIEIEIGNIKNKFESPELGLMGPMLSSALLEAATQLRPSVNKSPQTPQPTEPTVDHAAPAKAIALEPSTIKATEAPKESEAATSIRVPVSLLDSLMTLMGEMVLVRNQVLQFSSKSEDSEFLSLSKRLNSVTSEIQGEMMKTRMQPIYNTLNKFHRVVRDLSQELKKEINLSLVGSETELDKSLLESIKDPLTHIVRSACDHGIETRTARAQAGKKEQGQITIKSYHEGGQVIIEVTDDGKGLHPATLLQKAIEKNLVTSEQAKGLSERETFNLIFAPGFSTAASVTNVSGRGVGMDVVRTNVERIGGTVELNSRPGQGTTIKLKIPLTLAIIPALIVVSGNCKFAIPQLKLEELVHLDSNNADGKIEFLHGTPIYRLRGNILPLVDFRKLLKQNVGPESAEHGRTVAVLSSDTCSFGLIVDEIQDTADIVVKPINRVLKTLQLYSGATILGDGSIALILDVLGLSKLAEIGLSNNLGRTSTVDPDSDSLHENQEFLFLGLQNGTKHAISLTYVHRLEEFKGSAIENSGGHKVLRYGKTILPLISLSEQLGQPLKTPLTERDALSVVVIQKAGSFYGLVAEEIIDTQSTTAKTESPVVPQIGIFGNLNLPEELVVVIDPFALIDKAFPELVVNAAKATNTATPHLRILLVEDTNFFRKSITEILERAGHKVTSAGDGLEALDIL